jgi:hypothetical protein
MPAGKEAEAGVAEAAPANGAAINIASAQAIFR